MIESKAHNSEYVLEWYKPPSERENKPLKEAPSKPLVQSTANMVLFSWDPNADIGQHAGEKLMQGDFHRVLSRLGSVDEVQLNESNSTAKVVFSNPQDV